MIAIDTNVLVRFLPKGDPDQAAKARALIERQEVWVSVSVLLETSWVLLDRTRIAKTDVIRSLENLLQLPTVVVEVSDRIAQALGWAIGELDIADAFQLAAADDCEGFATFGRRPAGRAARLGVSPATVEP